MLAINGGKIEVDAAFRSFHHPIVDNGLRQAVIMQLEEAISLYGNEGIYRLVETDLKKRWNLEHALTVNSGTNALYSMYIASGIKPGDKVLIPAYTFFATGTPLLRIGAIPILVDSSSNGNLCPISLSERLKEIDYNAKAVVMTHMWGIPCELDAIISIAKKYDLLVLEDSSHAHGATYSGKVVGSFTDGSAWSFQGKKVLTSGEGGLYATCNKEFYDRAVLLGHFNIRAKDDVTTNELMDYRQTGTGLNMRMHVAGAAILADQLGKLDVQLQHRRETAEFMANRLSRISGLDLPRVPDEAEPAWYAFPVFFDSKYFSGVTKIKFVDAIISEGAEGADIPGSTCPLVKHKIFSHPGYMAFSYTEDQLKEIESYNSIQFNGADKFHTKLFKLPTFYGKDRMKYAEGYVRAIEKVCENVGELK